nr:MAG TPA: hypothetical protein [Caudoviricetes sp.]DAX49358.1 MAG TPA: hypothetical protein [Caudoviricetes sp.]
MTAGRPESILSILGWNYCNSFLIFALRGAN